MVVAQDPHEGEIEVLWSGTGRRHRYHRPDDTGTAPNCESNVAEAEFGTIREAEDRGTRPCQHAGCFGPAPQAMEYGECPLCGTEVQTLDNHLPRCEGDIA